MTKNQININLDKFLSEHFLSEIDNKAFSLELKQKIYEAYELRKKLQMSQKEWAKLKELSLMSVRRIENGKCYDVRLISKYSS